MLRAIHLYISASDHGVEKVEMIGASDDRTIIRFHDKRINAPVPDDAFEAER
jgi:outer membrane lipoprotein-sorting protein